MATNDNLKDFLTDVADAIREKKGTTEKINPQNFSTEIRSIGGGDSFDDGMEYYLVMDKETMNFYPENNDSWFAVFNTSIIEWREGNIIINGKQTGYTMSEYIAFSTTDKYIIDARDGYSIKQYIINILNENNISLDDTSKFKRITAAEYYSLLEG